MENLGRVIGEHPFFVGLGDEAIRLITGCATQVRFEPGHYVIRTGQEAKSVYLIRHGAVSIEIAAPGWDPIAIQTITDGEVLGWSWLVPPYHVAYDARVVAPTLAIAMDGTCIRDKCERDPRLGYELYKRVSGLMAERLQSTRLQLLDVYGPHR